MRPLHGPDQFVQFQLHRGAVPVLGILDEEHHQERDNGGAGVDDQLPGIAKSEERTGGCPDHDDQDGHEERQGMPHSPGRTGGKASKE
jgi:hypothetical protein